MIEVGNLEHARAIAAAAPCTFHPETDHVVSRSRDGKLLGGVTFTSYSVASINMHVAAFAPRWISNDLLWLSFSYPFEQLKVSKIIGLVPSRNLKALDFDLKLGFIQEARIADIYPDGEDLLILSMRREDCRWLKLKPRGA